MRLDISSDIATHKNAASAARVRNNDFSLSETLNLRTLLPGNPLAFHCLLFTCGEAMQVNG